MRSTRLLTAGAVGRRVVRPWKLLTCAALTSALVATAGTTPSLAKGAIIDQPMVLSGATPLPAHATCSSPAGLQSWEREASLAVDPENPDRLVTAWTQDWDDAIVVAASDDGGESWTKSVPRTTGRTWPSGDCDPEFQQYTSAGNPWVSFGPSGVVYVASGVSHWENGIPLNSAIVVNVSKDGGRTWAPRPAVLDRAANPVGVEFAHVVADPRRPGYAYALWTKRTLIGTTSNVYVAHSVDSGATWSAPSVIPASSPNRYPDYGRLLVLPDRNGRPQLLAVTGELPAQATANCCRLPRLTGPTTLVLSRSETFGVTWTPPTDLVEADPALRLIHSAYVASDGTPYLAWQAHRGRENHDPGHVLA